VFAIRKYIHQVKEKRQAMFVGFFGPMGVGAIFYLYFSLEFLEALTDDGEQRPDAEFLREVLTVVIWFLAICSIVSYPIRTHSLSQLNSPGGSWSKHPAG
jgi:hypothetical protein